MKSHYAQLAENMVIVQKIREICWTSRSIPMSLSSGMKKSKNLSQTLVEKSKNLSRTLSREPKSKSHDRDDVEDDDSKDL